MSAFGRRASGPLRLVVAVLAWLALCAVAAVAEETPAVPAPMQIHPTAEDHFGRLVLEFPGRLDLPKYHIGFDNGVLAITFDEPVTTTMPDMAAVLPDYVTIGRLDPDGKGVRFGLRTTFNVHSMEAGEKLFIDLLPTGWQGLPPSLPQSVIDALTQRAKDAAIIAEQKRKAEEAKALNPKATVGIGHDPTFTRIEFDWSADTQAKYAQDGNTATISFDWPVAVDLYALKADLPKEIVGVGNSVSAAGSDIIFTLKPGVTPRFYLQSPRQFVLDVDLTGAEVQANRTTAEALAKKAEADAEAARAAASKAGRGATETDPTQPQDAPTDTPSAPITPTIADNSGTIRVTFPFERDTPAAVFRRSDTLWMLFDTPTQVNQPARTEALASIATSFTVIPAGDTQIVRMDLSTDKLATLASEGRSWVLSIGNVLLDATQPVDLVRKRDADGHFEMTADLGKPYKVHSFRDPIVGDVLDVVTAYAPAKGEVRDLSYVDFDALASVHGLVIRPINQNLHVAVADNAARITAPHGLTLSDQDRPRAFDAGNAAEYRDSYVDFGALKEDNPAAFTRKIEELSADAAGKEGSAREVARLSLAQYYVGNQFAQEAIGVIEVMESDLKTDELRKKAQLTKAIADVLAARPGDALKILDQPGFSDEVDAMMWRAVARAATYDFVGARSDVLASEPVLDSYPVWVQQKFLFAGIRAALETSDVPMAQRLLKKISFAQLSPEDVTLYQLFQGRLAEATGQMRAALDAYGQVIAANVRPTRAEAVYRTLLILKQTGKIDVAKATATLSAETMMWRGDPLEIDMEKLLADLYFEHKDYRLGFQTVRDAALHSPESKPVAAMLDEAESEFTDLFLNGAANQLADLDALSLYYDFRQLTPPGAKGDEMIRNLARRLVKVDLLGQAADLLQYQIDSRLTGVARAQVAADLALIRIANRDPEGALRAINKTRMSGLSPTLERERRILEARALIDSGRQDLALDLLSQLKGRDADLLRVDAYWKGKSYDAASDLLDSIYSTDPTAPLGEGGRMNIIKAGVGLVLAKDTLGLSRLRSKFSERMAQSAQWPLFDYLTSPNVDISGLQFKAAAKAVASIDSITAFLEAYRQIYPVDPGLTPAAKTEEKAAA